MADDLHLGSRPQDEPLVATVTITIRFTHPMIDPSEITDTLGVSPTLSRRVGDPLIGIDGKVRPNIERQTRWVLRKKYYDRDAASDETMFDINERLARLLEPLARERAFVRRVAAGGVASIDVGLPGQYYLGFMIVPEILRMIGDLGLALGIEVFPDSAT